MSNLIVTSRGSEHFVVECDGKRFDVALDFMYPEMQKDERWFVHVWNNGWEHTGTFASTDFHDALYYISQGDLDE